MATRSANFGGVQLPVRTYRVGGVTRIQPTLPSQSPRVQEALPNQQIYLGLGALSYFGQVLADGPIAYYRTDEASGTVAYDASGGQSYVADVFNFINNPSFEYDTLNGSPGSWSTFQEGSAPAPATFAVQNGWAASGKQSLRVTTGNHTSSSNRLDLLPSDVACTPGTPVSATAVVNVLSIGASIQVALIVQFYNGTTFINETDGLGATAIGVQTLALTNVVAPANTTKARVFVGVQSGTGTTDFYLDDVIEVQAARAPAYFDGDFTGCSWSGTPGASSSQQGPYNATYNGGFTLSQTGALTGSGDTDASVAFDGSTGRIDLPSTLLEGTTAMTVEGWINPTSGLGGSNGPTLVMIGSYANSGTWIRTNNPGVGQNQINAGFSSGGSEVETAAAIVLGAWNHIVVTHDGTTGTLYVNGVGVSVICPWSAPSSSDTGGIGDWFGGSGGQHQFGGNVDEVAVYNYVLSPARVLAHYQAGTQQQSQPQALTFARQVVIAPRASQPQSQPAVVRSPVSRALSGSQVQSTPLTRALTKTALAASQAQSDSVSLTKISPLVLTLVTQTQSAQASLRPARAASATQTQTAPALARALSLPQAASQGQAPTSADALTKSPLTTTQGQTAADARRVGVVHTLSQGQTGASTRGLSRTPSATQTQTTTSTDLGSRSASVDQSQTASETLRPSRPLTATQAQAAAAGPAAVRILGALQSQAVTQALGLTRRLSPTQGQAASALVVPAVDVALSATQGQQATQRDSASRALAGTSTQQADATLQPSRSASSAQAQVATQTISAGRARSTSQGQAATESASQRLAKTLSAAQPQAGSETTGLSRTSAVGQGQATASARRVTRILLAADPQSSTLAVARVVRVELDLGQDQAAALIGTTYVLNFAAGQDQVVVVAEATDVRVHSGRVTAVLTVDVLVTASEAGYKALAEMTADGATTALEVI